MLVLIQQPLEEEVINLCRSAPVSQLRAITCLLQAHADSHHIVVAPPSICRILEECGRLSEEHRGVAKKIRSRYSELAGLEAILPVHAQVTVGVGGPIKSNGVWSLPFSWIANNGMSCTHLVCEDLYDCELSVEAGRDYLNSSALGRMMLSFDHIPGGGGNTHRVLADKAITRQRVTLCVADSDREEPSNAAPLGATASKCAAITGSGMYELSITPGRELENHIPSRLLDKVRVTWQGALPSERHVQLSAVAQGVPLFVDFKSGLKRKNVENLTGPSQIYWQAQVPQLIPGSRTCCPQQCLASSAGDCTHVLVAPLGRTLLKETKEYLELNANNPRRYREYLPSPNDMFWRSLGALVASYGVSVKVAGGM